MNFSRHPVLFAIMLSCLSVCVTGDCGFSEVDDCLQTTDLQQLPSNQNLSLFCSSAVSLAYKVRVCLDECNFIPSDSIRKFFARFESVCSDTPGCSNIGRFNEDIQRCFNASGGLSNLIADLIAAFNSKENVDTFCRQLAQGKNCIRYNAANCSYLAGLMNDTFDIYDQFANAQRICGSENVPRTSDNSNCANSKDMIASINRECDVSCSISATGDTDTICRFLQGQVDCFLRLSQGCTPIERRFLLPRLNTYAIANVLLDCPTPIQLHGVSIQPTGLDPDYPDNFRCKYTAQLNDCFNFNLPDDVRPDVIEKLLNGNFLVDYFCDLKASDQLYWDQLLNKCSDSFLRCRLPVADTYERATTYDGLYNVSIAPFPLDFWGLNTILTTLVCPNPVPPTLCKRNPSTIIASSLASLRPTPAITKRTTPIKRTNTPNRGSGSQDRSENEPQQQKLNSENAPTYKPTPQRTSAKSKKP